MHVTSEGPLATSYIVRLLPCTSCHAQEAGGGIRQAFSSRIVQVHSKALVGAFQLSYWLLKEATN